MIQPTTTGNPRAAHLDHSGTELESQSDLVVVVPNSPPQAASVEDLSATSLHSSSPASSDPHSGQLLRPIPTPSVNASQASFSFSDTNGGGNDGSALFDPLSPEIASADISIARE
jgi:hypothetical protein